MLDRVATLQEIRAGWSLYDVLDANDALDAFIEARRQE